MKNKLHIKRYGWIYMLVAVLIVVRLIINGLQTYRPLDEATVAGYLKWLDREVEERYGPSAPGWHKMPMLNTQIDLSDLPVEERTMHNWVGDPRVQRAMAFPDHVPALEPDLTAIRRVYGEYLEQMAAVFDAGNAYRPFGPMLRSERTDWQSLSQTHSGVPNFLLIQNYVKLRCAFAREAAAKGEWDRALEELRKASVAGDGIRTNFFIGHLIAVAARAIIYENFEEFLGEDAPTGIKRRAVTLLRDMRERDPEMNEIVIYSENLIWLLSTMAQGEIYGSALASSNFMQRVQLQGAALRLACYYDHFEDPGLKRFAKRLLSRKSQLESVPLSGFWTDDAAIHKFLRETAERESFVQELPIMQAQVWDEIDYDPMTRLALGLPGASYMGSMLEANTRTQVSRMRGYLVEVALAAEIYRTETGNWPDGLDALHLGEAPEIPELTSPDPVGLRVKPESWYWNARDDEFLAFDPSAAEIGWIENGDAALAAEVEIQMDIGTWQKLQSVVRRPDRGGYELLTDQQMQQEQATHSLKVRTFQAADEINGFSIADHPVLITALEQYLTKHEDWVSTASVYWAPELPDVMPVFYQGVSATRTRAMTDANDRFGWSMKSPTDRPPDALELERGQPEPGRIFNPPRMIYNIEWNPPKHTFTAWQGGPDGDDDRAMVLYDPTNGTISDGDLIRIVEFSSD